MNDSINIEEPDFFEAMLAKAILIVKERYKLLITTSAIVMVIAGIANSFIPPAYSTVVTLKTPSDPAYDSNEMNYLIATLNDLTKRGQYDEIAAKLGIDVAKAGKIKSIKTQKTAQGSKEVKITVESGSHVVDGVADGIVNFLNTEDASIKKIRFHRLMLEALQKDIHSEIENLKKMKQLNSRGLSATFSFNPGSEIIHFRSTLGDIEENLLNTITFEIAAPPLRLSRKTSLATAMVLAGICTFFASIFLIVIFKRQK